MFLNSKITLIAVLIFIVIVFLTRYVSLGSIVCAAFVPLAMIIAKEPLIYIVFTLVGAGLVILRHRANIQRLLSGQENKIGTRIDLKGGPR